MLTLIPTAVGHTWPTKTCVKLFTWNKQVLKCYAYAFLTNCLSNLFYIRHFLLQSVWYVILKEITEKPGKKYKKV